MVGIEHRGRDASGMAWWTKKGRIAIQKDQGTASKFVKRANISTRARTALIHVRAATKGSEYDNLNNHPIRHESIVGIHNGWLYNDDDIFEDLGVERYGEVDSEAIFAALQAKQYGDKPCSRLEYVGGPMATAWFHDDEPGVLHLAKGTSNPIAIVMTKGGSCVFASEMIPLRKVCDSLGLAWDWEHLFEEGSYMRIENGRIVEFDAHAFEPAKHEHHTWSKYTSSSLWRHDDDSPRTVVHTSAFDRTVRMPGEDDEWIPRALFRPGATIDPSFSEYATSYIRREEAIAELEDIRPMATERERWMCSLIPGDPCFVNLGDNKQRYGTVVQLPKTATTGNVLVRLHFDGFVAIVEVPMYKLSPGTAWRKGSARRNHDGTKTVVRQLPLPATTDSRNNNEEVAIARS